MIRGLKGAIIMVLSMLGIIIIAALHEIEVISLSVWVYLPLVFTSFIITLLGAGKMYDEFAEGEVTE